jgi:hypothetical protein
MLTVPQNKVGEQKYCSLFGRYSLVLLITSASTLLSAQSFSDFKRVQSESFKEYKDEKDSAFNKYLKAEWEAFSAQKPLSLYEEPKPQEIPTAKLTTPESIGPKIIIEIKAPKETIEAENTTPLSIQEIPQQVVIEKKVLPKDVTFDFFGTALGFNMPSGIDRAKFYPQNQEGISNFFDAIVIADYKPLLEAISQTSKMMNLNDWGLYQLVTKLSEKLFSNQDEAKLFSWFTFNKLGYAVRVGLERKSIVLMHYSAKDIYATPNYTIDSKRFYVLSNYAKESVGSVYTYKQNYPDAEKALDLALRSLPILNDKMQTKVLSFKKYGNEYSISYNYNQNILDFMASYPQADYETYFNAPIENRSYGEIAKAMKKYIDGKQASEAMNFVLSFVQNAFEYETDFQQFGREKVMFAEETLFFDKSDCEDRAVLFSYLIKELFGVGVLGVKYKDHMATALYVPIQGDKVQNGSRQYVIADPTYINAVIGESMPKYRPIKPEGFIVVSNSTKRL